MSDINDAYNLQTTADLGGIDKAQDGVEDLVDSILKADNASDDITQSADKGANAISGLGNKSEHAGDDVDDLVNSLDKTDNGMKKAGDGADDLSGDLDQTGKQADETEELVDNLNKTTGESEGIFSKAAGGMGSFTSAALGAATAVLGLGVLQQATGFITDSIGAGFELEKQLNRIGDATGLMGSELDEAKTIARDLWAVGFGESPQEVVDALSTVQNITDATGESLRQMTTDALALSQTFGFDIQESTRAANQLMEQFGISGEEAFDIVAGVMQTTGDPAGDLLDTLQEYSSIFAEMGLSADEVANHLINSSEAGVFGYDKTADAMREFTIRFREGGEEAETAFNTLIKKTDEFFIANDDGTRTAIKNFDDLNAKVEDGSITIADAGDMMRDALMEIEDPAERAALATSLIGTQYEDLGEDILAAFDDDGTLTNFDGTMASIAENTLKNISPWDRFKRGIQTFIGQAAVPVINLIFDRLNPALEAMTEWLTSGGLDGVKEFSASLLDDLIPMVESAIAFVEGLIETFQNFVSENPQVIQIIGMVAGAIASAVGVFLGFNTIIAGVTAVVGTLTTGFAVLAPVIAFLLSPIGLLIVAAAALAIAYQTNFMGFADAVNTAVDFILTKLAGLYDWFVNTGMPFISGAVNSFITDVWTPFKDGVSAIWDSVGPALASLLDWFITTGIPAIVTAVNGFITDVLTPMIDTLAGIWTTVSPVLQSLLDWFLTTGLLLIQGAIQLYMDNYVQPMIDLMLSIWTTIQPSLQSLYDWFMTTGLNLIQDAIQLYMDNYVTPMINLVKGIWDAVSPALASFLDWFQTTGIPVITEKIQAVIDMFNNLRDRINTIWDAVSSAINTFKTNFTGIFDALLAPIQDVIDMVQDLIDMIANIDFPDIPKIPGITGLIGDAGFAAGGQGFAATNPFGQGFGGPSSSSAGSAGQVFEIHSYLMVDGQVLAQSIERVKAESPSQRARPTPPRLTMGVR